ncbi:MAG: phage minor capsid protein [Oscillospiraceae bacterium]
MLTPQTLQHLPDEIIDLVNEVQMDIIRSIAKKLVKSDYLTPSAEWQLYKASQLRMSTDDVNSILSKMTGKSKRQIQKLYTEACKKAINEDAKIYRAYGKDCSSALRSVSLSNTLKAGIKNANGMMNNLTKSMVESSRATVTHLMDNAYIKVTSGAFTYQEAIYDSVLELASQGIKSVTYPSGHTDWVDVAVRRAVMTGISQTAGQMQLDLAAEMDCDLVEVTAHMGARPSHALWQGKVYSISGKSKKYPKLSTATGYGTGAGLKGWNCRHDFYPYFDGISERANLPVDLDENQEEYELSQQQRAMERSIRKSKRTCAALDAAINETDDDVLKRKLQNKFERHSAILKEKEKRLNKFCGTFGMQKQNDRVRVVGFNRSVSQKVVQGNKKYLAKKLDKSIVNGTIDYNTYSEMLKKRIIVDNKDLKNGLPINGKPNSIVDMLVDGKVSQRRVHGSDGKALVDFDTHDHNRPDLHPTGAHKQVFNYNKKNPHGKPTGLTDQELINNSDIIQRGVNYRDPK